MSSPMTRDPKSFTVVELKEILKQKGLSTAGSKNELISRLFNVEPCNAWFKKTSAKNDENAMGLTSQSANQEELQSYDEDGARSIFNGRNDGNGDVGDMICLNGSNERLRRDNDERERMRQREIEIYRQEKELAERELALASREIEFLRWNQDDRASNGWQDILFETTSHEKITNRNQFTSVGVISSPILPTKINVTAIADLLSYFNGDSEIYETWEKQVKFLRTAYKLDDDLTKILIGTRLKGRAMEWFHSKPEYIGMTSDRLLDGLRGMFYHRPNKIALRYRFEGRVWKRNETFHDYVLHEKVIMANRIAINDDEVLGYIIEFQTRIFVP
ncbi:unnamed protein product [Lasius platythorax]|uniref:SAP domain-containing protein n=2 Tax=Lasius TaxID=488720 RepID=A0A0J7KSW7_LASNI|nr:hypothetical protein RF55_6468 [Lasius niger]